jgi:hypothetical protein
MKTADMAIVTPSVLVLIIQALVSMVTAQNPGKCNLLFCSSCFQGSKTHFPLPADELTKIGGE